MRLRSLLTALLVVFALVGMACNGDDDTDVTTDLGGDDDTTTTAGEDGEASRMLNADLSALNDSGASGTATVEINGNQITVTVETDGVSNQPHAQHIHIGGKNECPDESLSGDDDLITTAEGAPAYGGVQVSLTTDGDVSAESALAVPRFPVAEDNSYEYERTFELPSGVTESDIENGVIVVHGISELFGDENAYDGDEKSSLDPSLPLEATIPSACGALS